MQPLLVLMEIPIDVAFALVLLWICGHTLNLMSAIGLIVTCGIVINDSILKLDAINELRKEGVPLLEAIHEAGRRRLRPIIMTSLTTIFAMVPLLFSYDLGSEPSEAAFHCHDWYHDDRYTGEFVYHPFTVLVYL